MSERHDGRRDVSPSFGQQGSAAVAVRQDGKGNVSPSFLLHGKVAVRQDGRRYVSPSCGSKTGWQNPSF
ncbi:MAG: hypothetical protein ACK53Y_26855 [bacterium]